MQTLSTQALTWADFQPRYHALETEVLTAENAAAWLKRWSDLENDLREEFTRVNRAKDEDTKNKVAEAQFLEFIQNVSPNSAGLQQVLESRILALEWIPQPQHVQMLKRIRTYSELFSEKNIPLDAEIRTLANEYNKLSGALRITLDGETLNMSQAHAKLEQPDPILRQQAWHKIAQSRLEIAPQLDEVFLQLLKMRRQSAHNAGFSTFLEYCWKGFVRFDYTPQDARDLHESIALEVVPVLARLNQKRQNSLGLETLRPWDVFVDPQGRAPLQPFQNVTELEEGAERVFHALDPELGQYFSSIRAAGNLSLEPSENKIPGLGYGFPLPSSQQVYIYWSAVGIDADLRVILHESGHAMHFLSSMGSDYLHWNMFAPLEFAETISQGMELLTLPLLEKPIGWYSPQDAQRSKRNKLEVVLNQFIIQARSDAFQHWVYDHAPEQVTAAELDAKWLELSQRYAAGVDWSGLEREQSKAWHSNGHIFSFPLYMLEYSIGWLGALQIWRNSLENPQKALEQYKYSLTLGNTKPVPELFAAAGIKFAFDQDTVRELMEFVADQLELN